MKKDKRGLALITAIAVLALMLILFAGLTMVYSAQVSRGKAELEQSQAMLMAQSYAEMLDQVLTSSSGEADGLKEELGKISTGKEVEIKSSLDNQPDDVIDSQVKITATAEKASTSGNTTTRKIKIKVSATVDNETRSIDLDYTYKKVTGGVMDYAVYGNTVDYENQSAKSVVFNNDWYYIYNDPRNPSSKEEKLVDDPQIFTKEKTYKYGYVDNDKVFRILKDGIIQSKDGDYNTFGMAVNKNDSNAELPSWSGFSEPDGEIPECTKEIKTSCIWDNDLTNDVTVNAEDEDIIIFMPVNQDLTLEKLTISFNGKNPETGELNQLYIYIYSERDTAKNNNLTIESSVKFANLENQGRSQYLDIFVICNDEINLKLDLDKRVPEILEAYFYFPKGTILWETQTNEKNYTNQIRGCLIANKIVIKGDGSKQFNQVGVDYVPPRDIEGSGSSKATITYILNSYEEGGRS